MTECPRSDPKIASRLFWLFCWGVCFGYIEAAVVVYLRRIYYPDGFAFPLLPMEPNLAAVEVVREAVTLVFMWAVAELSFARLQDKVAAYMVVFGVWDILFYAFLKATLDWPSGLTDWDILFLIPMPWAGPVWAPVAVSAALIVSGVVILVRSDQGRSLQLGRRFWMLETACGAAIVASFLIPGRAVLSGAPPEHYPWYLFWPALAVGSWVFVSKTRSGPETRKV